MFTARSARQRAIFLINPFFALFVSMTFSVWAADPELQLLIIDVELEQSTDRLTINGENFDNGGMPQVFLDAVELPVLGLGLPDSLVASLEYHPPLKGNYLLEVSTGDLDSQNDMHCFAVDESGNVYGCSDPPSSSWTQKDRVSVRHVPKGPSGAETDDTVLFTWKDGPTNINSFSNSWGDPKWFQLDEDYTIDLRLILNHFPEELDRCDDSYLGEQRSTRLELLDDLDCLEWSENKQNPVCPANSNDPGEGYLLLKDGMLTVRRGYRWDGASMVFPFTKDVRIYPKTAALMRPTVVHDAFYDLLRMKIPNDQCDDFSLCRFQVQKLADCMLYMLSRQDGYDLRKAKANFTTVREFGWTKSAGKVSSWKTHALADAGPDQTHVCAGPDGLKVKLDSSGTRFASTDRNWISNGVEIPGTHNDPAPEFRLPAGRHRIWLEVDYREGTDWLQSDHDDVTIDIQRDTEAPTVTSADDMVGVPNEPGRCGAVVEFKVIANDNCGCPDIDCSPKAGSWFDVGTSPVHCTVTDVGQNTVSASLDVTVEDVEAPVIEGIDDPLNLWPLNHKYHTFAVEDFVTSVEDNCDSIPVSQVTIARATSDEAEDGNGDGNTKDDIVISSDRKSVMLRAERLENSNGRVYTIHLEVTDTKGNTGSAQHQVHSADTRHGWAIDDGVVLTVE